MTSADLALQWRIRVNVQFGASLEAPTIAGFETLIRHTGMLFAVGTAIEFVEDMEREGKKYTPQSKKDPDIDPLELMRRCSWAAEHGGRIERIRYNSPLDLLLSFPESWAGISGTAVASVYAVMRLWSRYQNLRADKAKADVQVELLKSVTHRLKLDQSANTGDMFLMRNEVARSLELLGLIKDLRTEEEPDFGGGSGSPGGQ